MRLRVVFGLSSPSAAFALARVARFGLSAVDAFAFEARVVAFLAAPSSFGFAAARVLAAAFFGLAGASDLAAAFGLAAITGSAGGSGAAARGSGAAGFGVAGFGGDGFGVAGFGVAGFGGDGFGSGCFAAGCGGFVAVDAGSPVDVAKARLTSTLGTPAAPGLSS